MRLELLCFECDVQDIIFGLFLGRYQIYSLV